MERQRYGISQDWLKVIAMVSMAVDHTGVVLFPGVLGWRLIGRMAFPAYQRCEEIFPAPGGVCAAFRNPL